MVMMVVGRGRDSVLAGDNIDEWSRNGRGSKACENERLLHCREWRLLMTKQILEDGLEGGAYVLYTSIDL